VKITILIPRAYQMVRMTAFKRLIRCDGLPLLADCRRGRRHGLVARIYRWRRTASDRSEPVLPGGVHCAHSSPFATLRSMTDRKSIGDRQAANQMMGAGGAYSPVSALRRSVNKPAFSGQLFTKVPARTPGISWKPFHSHTSSRCLRFFLSITVLGDDSASV
jgi:hypothetical protein